MPADIYNADIFEFLCLILIIITMKKVVFENGLTLVLKEKNGSTFGLSVTFKCGHINEPKLGLAALYENIVSRLSESRIASVYGGSLTSFYTTGKTDDFASGLQQLHDTLVLPPLTDELVQEAAADIIKHTRDLSPLPLRQTKLAYKHTAFGQNHVVWDTEQYIKNVEVLTVADVKSYISSCFNGSNVVVGYTGPKTEFAKVEELCRSQFGHLIKGQRKNLKNLLYTGGFQRIESNSNTQIAMFGWDISKATSMAAVSVLMGVLANRLERQLSAIPAVVDVKLAGYFGFRTLRVSVMCENPKKFNECLNITCANIKRLHKDYASARRMETAKQKAMTSAISKNAQPSAVEIAWHVLGRDTDWDIDDVISQICCISPRDVQDAASMIVARQLTCVLYTNCCNISYRDFEAMTM